MCARQGCPSRGWLLVDSKRFACGCPSCRRETCLLIQALLGGEDLWSPPCQFSCLVSCSSQTRGVASSCNLSTRGVVSNQRSCDHLFIISRGCFTTHPLDTRLPCSPDMSRSRHIAQARRPAVAAAAAAAAADDDEDGGLGRKRAGDHHK